LRGPAGFCVDCWFLRGQLVFAWTSWLLCGPAGFCVDNTDIEEFLLCLKVKILLKFCEKNVQTITLSNMKLETRPLARIAAGLIFSRNRPIFVENFIIPVRVETKIFVFAFSRKFIFVFAKIFKQKKRKLSRKFSRKFSQKCSVLQNNTLEPHQFYAAPGENF
jgi:hypothetical protein